MDVLEVPDAPQLPIEDRNAAPAGLLMAIPPFGLGLYARLPLQKRSDRRVRIEVSPLIENALVPDFAHTQPPIEHLTVQSDVEIPDLAVEKAPFPRH